MKLLAVDANSILNRAFYGIRLLSNDKGVYTNAILGFMNILLKVIDDEKPDRFIFAFDVKGKTFRHEMYDGYKAGRSEMPEELAMQFPIIKEILVAMGYSVLERPGFEADDILGTAAKMCENESEGCIIMTGDRDCLQLVSEKTSVRLASTKGGQPLIVTYDEAAIHEKYGVSPLELIEVKGLMGDASDKIPGVAGIGEKTALKFISEYKNIDNLYENIEEAEFTPKMKERLNLGKDSALLSRQLGRIATDVPMEMDCESYKKGEGDPARLAAILSDLSMNKLMERLGVNALEQLTLGDETGETVKSESIITVMLTSEKALQIVLAGIERIFLAAEIDAGELKTIAFTEGTEYYLLKAEDFGEGEFIQIFADIANSVKEVIVGDSKPLYSLAFEKGISIKDFYYDTSLAAYLINPLEKSYIPEILAIKYGAKPAIFDEEAPVLMEAYAVKIAFSGTKEALGDGEELKLLKEVELPLARVLASMEVAGFKVDEKGVRDFGLILDKKIMSLEENIYFEAEETFNINSPKQLSEILFEKLSLPTKKKTKTGFSTNAEVLDELRGYHPIIEYILEYRQVAKLKSTYVDGLIKAIQPDGRIRTSFMQTETRTGRISSTDPNLQNIPVRTELGREMRKFFVAKEGCLLIDADYSQIELRVLAHIANDEMMIKAFEDKVDIHRLTASQVFHVPLDMVTDKMRNDSKAVNFGIVYGISAFSLSKDIGASVSEAKSYIDNYLKTYAGVAKYMEETVAEAKENGYVKTMFGRRRPLPEINAKNFNEKSFGERVAMNMPIQGTAADIIKIAMVRVYERLLEEKLQARLILQVHDELIIEAPLSEAKRAELILKEEMEQAADLKAPLEVDISAGETWFESKG